MNEQIEMLYNKIDKQNKIIDEQVLEIARLKKIINDADEFCDRYIGCKLELFDMYELLDKVRKILGDE